MAALTGDENSLVIPCLTRDLGLQPLTEIMVLDPRLRGDDSGECDDTFLLLLKVLLKSTIMFLPR